MGKNEVVLLVCGFGAGEEAVALEHQEPETYA